MCGGKFQRIGLIGLDSAPTADDLRESPLVELAERLLGKGYELRVFDPNVSVAQLTGSNKEYIHKVIPHLSRLLVGSLEDLAACEFLVVGHRYPGVRDFLKSVNLPAMDLDGPSL